MTPSLRGRLCSFLADLNQRLWDTPSDSFVDAETDASLEDADEAGAAAAAAAEAAATAATVGFLRGTFSLSDPSSVL